MSNLRFAAWYNLFLASMAALALILRCDPLWAIAFAILWLVVGLFIARCVERLHRVLCGIRPLQPPLMHAADPLRPDLTLCGMPIQETTHYQWSLDSQTMTCPYCRKRVLHGKQE